MYHKCFQLTNAVRIKQKFGIKKFPQLITQTDTVSLRVRLTKVQHQYFAHFAQVSESVSRVLRPT